MTILTFNVAKAQSTTAGFDEGFLKGIKPAMSLMTTYDGIYGDIDHLMRTFVIRRNTANKVAQGIDNEVQSISNGLLKIALQEISRDIKSAPQGGDGDFAYHRALLIQQNSVLVRVSEKVATLNQLVVKGQEVTTEREVGFLKGLKVAMTAMTVYDLRYGEIDYHIRTFAIRRNMANRVAQGILAELQNVDNPLLRGALNELAKDIQSAPQGGFDNHIYMLMLKEQNTVLVRVAQKLNSVISVVESAQAEKSCSKNFSL